MCARPARYSCCGRLVSTPTRQSGHDRYARLGQFRGKLGRGCPAVRGNATCAYYGDRKAVLWRDLTQHVENRWSVVYLAQTFRVVLAIPGKHLGTRVVQPVHLAVGIGGSAGSEERLGHPRLETRGLEIAQHGAPRGGCVAEIVEQACACA